MVITEQKSRYLEVQKEIESLGFTVVAHDFERPWGGFLVIEEACRPKNFPINFLKVWTLIV